MKFTRREFGQSALGAAALGALGGLQPHSADAAGRVAATRTTTTFHFDLKFLGPLGAHVLRCAGRRYPLLRHTAQTLLAARRANHGLQTIPDDRITHYVPDVQVSKTRVHRMHVTTLHPVRGHGLALVAMYIPAAARQRARTHFKAKPTQACCLGAPADCPLQDQVLDDYLTGWTTAKSIITHHPDLCTVDPDTAAVIETHMDYDQSAAVSNLTLSICDQGPAYEHDPAWRDGWAVLVKMMNGDGTPLLDLAGQQVFDYQFSDDTSIDMKPSIESILSAVKNDPSLDGNQYEVIYHGDPVDESQLPPPNPPVLAGGSTVALKSALGQRLALRSSTKASTSATSNVKFSTLGYTHNILFYNPSAAADGRSFTLSLVNLNFVWYGIYFEYLDASGKALSSPDRSSTLLPLRELSPVPIDLETDELKFFDLLSPPPTIFGLPIPTPYRFSVQLPAGASQVRIHLVGPGGHGKLPYTGSVVAGTVFTAIVGYAVPTYFLTLGEGLDEDADLVDLLTQNGTFIKTLLVCAQAYYAVAGSSTNQLGLLGSIESYLLSVLQDTLLINLKWTIPELYTWIVSKQSEEAAEESVPFVGWVMRIIAILGTVADIVATSAEIATNPVDITNNVSFTNSVTVRIYHDPDDFEFPLTATQYEVTITVSDKALDPVVVKISNQERSNDYLETVVENVPTTGAAATVSVVFKSDTGYPVAHSCEVDDNGEPLLDENGNRIPGDITFLDASPSDGSPIHVVVQTVENPVPITSSTVYSHHHKLGYTNNRYYWNYTSQPPALEALACGTGATLCDLGQVSIWLPGGMIGYSWVASSPSVRQCRTGAAGQLYNFQNLSLKNDPNGALKSPGCGFAAPVPIGYDVSTHVGNPGHHFYVDPISISDSSPEFMLRSITLDTSTPINVNTTQSWGRFRINVDRIAVYTSGQPARVVAISTRNHKFSVLELPTTPYTDDTYANNAKVMSGPGESNDSLILNPIALTIASNGCILILQGGNSKSVKAFDFDGKPWKFFGNGKSSMLPLAQDVTSTITWLDIAVESTNLLYVLSYTGNGLSPSDYRLDIYDSNTGQKVVRNTGIGVARIIVDKFRGLYSLNRETLKGSPIVEPSVSVWAPSTPPGAPKPR